MIVFEKNVAVVQVLGAEVLAGSGRYEFALPLGDVTYVRKGDVRVKDGENDVELRALVLPQPGKVNVNLYQVNGTRYDIYGEGGECEVYAVGETG